MCEVCRRYPCHSSCPNAPEPPVFGVCYRCGSDIYYGDEYYDILGNYYCKECIDWCRQFAEAEDV